MKKILITSGNNESELEFARMLELELSEKGCEIITSESENGFTQVFIYDVCDPDALRSRAASDEKRDVRVICCAYEVNGTLPLGTIYVERPFDVSKFCEYITGTDSSDSKHQESVKSDITIDKKDNSVTFHGKQIVLTDKESAVLLCLDSRRGSPVTRDEIFASVWGKEKISDTNIVDVNIRYLRKKIDEKFGCRVILTVRGKGYMLK